MVVPESTKIHLIYSISTHLYSEIHWLFMKNLGFLDLQNEKSWTSKQTKNSKYPPATTLQIACIRLLMTTNNHPILSIVALHNLENFFVEVYFCGFSLGPKSGHQDVKNDLKKISLGRRKLWGYKFVRW